MELNTLAVDQVTEQAQAWLDQLICPECKEKYPERTVQYEHIRGLSSHRFHRHQVRSEAELARVNHKPMFEKNSAGFWICPECKRDDFKMAFLVGKHRKSEHGIKGTFAAHRKPKLTKPAPKPVHATKPAVREASPEVSMDGPAIYLYGRLEAQIEAYAAENKLPAKSLVHMVGELLAAA